MSKVESGIWICRDITQAQRESFPESPVCSLLDVECPKEVKARLIFDKRGEIHNVTTVQKNTPRTPCGVERWRGTIAATYTVKPPNIYLETVNFS